MRQTLEEAIWKKYIAPTERKAQKTVGVEFEFPLLNLERKPVFLPAVQEVVRQFSKIFQFTDQKTDDNGNLYSMTNPVNGDNLSFDCSYNTLELSFGKEENIHVLNQRFRAYFEDLQNRLQKSGHMLTGMGINPYHEHIIRNPIANDRYRMLYHHLCAYPKYQGIFYHDIPEFGMIAAASQVQLDIQKEDIIQAIHAYNLLEPFKAILFANSYYERFPELLLSRDYLWRYSSQGYNPHNLGMYETEIQSLDEYLTYIKTQSIYCVQKEEKYLHFEPIPLYAYVNLDSVTGTYFADETWQEYTFKPEAEDIAHHRSFKFADFTYRGTIEFRSACEQPVSEVFAHAAFHAGLAQKLTELTALLEADKILYHQGFTASELRELFTRRNVPEFFDRKQLSDRLIQILNLAQEGLTERGFEEEAFLAPLFERAEKLINPAKDFLNGLQKGEDLETWIARYAEL